MKLCTKASFHRSTLFLLSPYMLCIPLSRILNYARDDFVCIFDLLCRRFMRGMMIIWWHSFMLLCLFSVDEIKKRLKNTRIYTDACMHTHLEFGKIIFQTNIEIVSNQDLFTYSKDSVKLCCSKKIQEKHANSISFKCSMFGRVIKIVLIYTTSKKYMTKLMTYTKNTEFSSMKNIYLLTHHSLGFVFLDKDLKQCTCKSRDGF